VNPYFFVTRSLLPFFNFSSLQIKNLASWDTKKNVAQLQFALPECVTVPEMRRAVARSFNISRLDEPLPHALRAATLLPSHTEPRSFQITGKDPKPSLVRLVVRLSPFLTLFRNFFERDASLFDVGHFFFLTHDN